MVGVVLELSAGDGIGDPLLLLFCSRVLSGIPVQSHVCEGFVWPREGLCFNLVSTCEPLFPQVLV